LADWRACPQEKISEKVGLSQNLVSEIIGNTNFGNIDNLLSQGHDMDYIARQLPHVSCFSLGLTFIRKMYSRDYPKAPANRKKIIMKPCPIPDKFNSWLCFALYWAWVNGHWPGPHNGEQALAPLIMLSSEG